MPMLTSFFRAASGRICIFIRCMNASLGIVQLKLLVFIGCSVVIVAYFPSSFFFFFFFGLFFYDFLVELILLEVQRPLRP